MALEVVAPSGYAEAILSDLKTRRGQINGLSALEEQTVVDATVPIGSLFGYASSLRALTSGEATYTMSYRHYAAVPPKNGPDDPDNFPPAVGMRA
jgi:elongation factor G